MSCTIQRPRVKPPMEAIYVLRRCTLTYVAADHQHGHLQGKAARAWAKCGHTGTHVSANASQHSQLTCLEQPNMHTCLILTWARSCQCHYFLPSAARSRVPRQGHTESTSGRLGSTALCNIDAATSCRPAAHLQRCCEGRVDRGKAVACSHGTGAGGPQGTPLEVYGTLCRTVRTCFSADHSSETSMQAASRPSFCT